MQTSNDGTRLITLDALRGFAVMGILAMNIVAYSMPQWAYVTPLAYGGETTTDRAAWLFSFIFIDGKMRGLFSLLFGASMMLIIERAQAYGKNAAKIHYSRMLWLALFGLGHYFFFWYGDILFLYAAIGCIAFLFHKWEPMRLIKWALIIFAIGVVAWGFQFGGLQILQMTATEPGASADLVKQYQEIKNSPDFSLNVAKELALYRGSYETIFADRLKEWYSPLTLIPISLAETLPLMMIGMAMKKNGFLAGEWSKASYVRWTKRLVPAGLLLTAALGGWVIYMGYELITSLAVFLAWSGIPRLMLTIGYAAVLIIVIERFASSMIIARVAAAGQAAFTNYLGTSIFMTSLFYGYGLGLFGQIGRLELWLFVFGAWAVMLLWSKPWLARFRYGPLEWLWRSLARLKMQPLVH